MNTRSYATPRHLVSGRGRERAVRRSARKFALARFLIASLALLPSWLGSPTAMVWPEPRLPLGDGVQRGQRVPGPRAGCRWQPARYAHLTGSGHRGYNASPPSAAALLCDAVSATPKRPMRPSAPGALFDPVQCRFYRCFSIVPLVP